MARAEVPPLTRLLWAALVAYALVQIGVVLAVFANHAPAPFNLEAMESTVLEHVRRLMAGQAIYTDPTARFAALAYNPLYYFVSVPFVWAFGSTLLALRLSAILATLGAAGVLFRIVSRHTGARAWGVIAVGLFAAAYRVMDCYLDTAHSDAWMLFAILLGCDLIDQDRSRRRNTLGIVALVAAFWFKQHGAMFAVGALIYVTARDGWRRAWPAWAIASVLGPLLYWVAPAWLGPRFHVYAWQEPRQWLGFDDDTLGRLLRCIAVQYPVLSAAGIGGLLVAVRRRRLDVWSALLPVALLSGLLGALDSGSNDNVFIPMGVWFILTGVIALKQLVDRSVAAERWGAHVALLAVSWALFAYDPRSVFVPAEAYRATRDLAAYARSLDGPVYAPMIGALPQDNPFTPTLHWVALEDMIRRPGMDESNHPLTRRLLASVLAPKGSAYLLLASPLGNDELLGFLSSGYALEQDLDDRFASLTGLPRRFEVGGPRYLYCHVEPPALEPSR